MARECFWVHALEPTMWALVQREKPRRLCIFEEAIA